MHARPRLSVVTGTYNRLSMLQAMVASVREQCFAGELEVVVVDGGSTDGSKEWLLRQPDIVTVFEHNRDQQGRMKFGWPVCYNRGFGAAASDFVCMLNDDLLVEPNCLENGVRRLEQDPVAGGVAFYFHDANDPKGHRVGHAFGGRLFVNYGIYRRELWHQLGGLDGNTYRFYHADTDFSLRCWELRRPILAAPDCRIRHFPDYDDPQRKANCEAARAAGDWETYVRSWSHLKRSPKDNGYWQYLDGRVEVTVIP
ncbi:MAG: glycosyltransferase family 2 protein [Planctomycetota bacterium]|jgi:GT2 family glycosyltransferase